MITALVSVLFGLVEGHYDRPIRAYEIVPVFQDIADKIATAIID